MKNLTSVEFKPENDPRSGRRTENWFLTLSSGLEVVVRGDASGPLQLDIDQATCILVNLEQLQQKAIRLLEGFMRDEGAWSLTAVDCGLKAEKLECTFVLTFYFEADKAPFEYGYTYFDVCFSVRDRSLPIDVHGHPIKFVVGFH